MGFVFVEPASTYFIALHRHFLSEIKKYKQIQA